MANEIRIGGQDQAPCACCATRADWWEMHIDPDDTYLAAIKAGALTENTPLDYEGLDYDFDDAGREAFEAQLTEMIAEYVEVNGRLRNLE